MWDGLFSLLTVSTIMALASFLAGSIPLSLGLSQKHARAITAVGTGMLIGTCLIIIIPEGVETLYSANAPHDHAHRRLRLLRDEGDMTPAVAGPIGPAGSPETDAASGHREPHAYTGLSIILGFVLMYLIDRLPRHASTVASGRSKSRYISLADLGRRRSSQPQAVEDGTLGTSDGGPTSHGSATTLGLVIHAAADGIALAASSFISSGSTGFIVFLAIMVHKAPAAFGLTSVLIKQGFTKRLARAHLLVFSMAAPVGAIATWALVHLLSDGRIEGTEGTKFATGLLLLFSGGTFLYVAMHTMQEQANESHDYVPNAYAGDSAFANGSAAAHSEHTASAGLSDTLLTVLGMLLPLLAQLFAH